MPILVYPACKQLWIIAKLMWCPLCIAGAVLPRVMADRTFTEGRPELRVFAPFKGMPHGRFCRVDRLLKAFKQAFVLFQVQDVQKLFAVHPAVKLGKVLSRGLDRVCHRQGSPFQLSLACHLCYRFARDR